MSPERPPRPARPAAAASPPMTTRPAALFLLGLACGDIDSAARTARTLEDAAGHQHPQAYAATERACGRLAAAAGDREAAAPRLRNAT